MSKSMEIKNAKWVHSGLARLCFIRAREADSRRIQSFEHTSSNDKWNESCKNWTVIEFLWKKRYFKTSGRRGLAGSWGKDTVTPIHWKSLPLTKNYSLSLKITPIHWKSLSLNVNHSHSHWKSLPLTQNHSHSMKITQTPHWKSLPFTENHPHLNGMQINLRYQAYLTKPTKPYLLNRPSKPNLQYQAYKTKPTKPYLLNKPTKPNLPNQTYQTKPTKPNLPNQTKPT